MIMEMFTEEEKETVINEFAKDIAMETIITAKMCIADVSTANQYEFA